MKFKDFFNEDWTVNWERIDSLSWFKALSTTPQSKKWHMEGDCLTHTKMVVSAMRLILNENKVKVGSDMWVMCMMAAMCHDLGKPSTTKWSDEKNDYVTKNHGAVGERITRNLFSDEEIIMRECVCYMVRKHMDLHHILDNESEIDSKIKRLSHGLVPIKYMIMLNKSDSWGSLNDIEKVDEIDKKEMFITNKSIEMGCYEQPYSFVSKSELIRQFIGYSDEVVNDSNDFCVYILCGFPGCGKSTYINNNLSEVKVISRDIIRQELGIDGATLENDKKVVGSKEEENKVSDIFNERLIECCEKKESFAIDNTNLKWCYRKDYLMKVMKYNPKIEIIYIEAPNFIKDCKERRKGEITASVYDRMNDSFDFPQLYECHRLTIVKQKEDGNDATIIDGDLVPSISDSFDHPTTLTNIITDLMVARVTMILEGYECEDTCIKIMDHLIEKYKESGKNIKIKNI